MWLLEFFFQIFATYPRDVKIYNTVFNIYHDMRFSFCKQLLNKNSRPNKKKTTL